MGMGRLETAPQENPMNTTNHRNETPIQANRRLCAEAGRDTLPQRMGSAIKAFDEARFQRDQERARHERDIERIDNRLADREEAEQFDTANEV